jgi:hypothetical protein
MTVPAKEYAQEDDKMDPVIVGALIGVVGVIGGVLLQHFLPDILARLSSRDDPIPDIVGEWDGEWYFEKDGKQDLYTKDKILIEKRKGFRIFGKGKDPAIPDQYVIRGRFSMSNIFTLSYRFPKGPISLTGVVLLKLDPSGNHFDGWWWGYTMKGIIGGEVKWSRKTKPWFKVSGE